MVNLIMRNLGAKSKKINIVGIMSGTSMDGVDFVLMNRDQKTCKYKDMGSAPYPRGLRAKLLNLAEGELGFRESQKIHFELGKFYSSALERIAKKKKWKFDLIGLHGQTVFHEAPHATTQIGEPSFLKNFNVPVVSDFRSKILSVGGQGAPLAPVFHNELMKGKKNWGFLNLGGMSNLSFREKGGLHATDLGPGNVYLDFTMKTLFNKDYDKGGSAALRGIPDPKIVKDYTTSEKFFKKKSPKSCGREDFSQKKCELLLRKMKKHNKYDIVATMAEISLDPIIKELKKRKLIFLVVSGGGAFNTYLMKRLEESFPNMEIVTSDEMGWPIQAVEGGAFALLAAYKHFGIETDLSYMGITKKLSPLGRID